jgi:hypothetical protein
VGRWYLRRCLFKDHIQYQHRRVGTANRCSDVWAYLIENGQVTCHIKPAISSRTSIGWIVNGDFPSIAALGPGFDGRFGFVVAGRAKWIPPTADKVQTIDYAVWETWPTTLAQHTLVPVDVGPRQWARQANQLQGARPPLTPLPTFSERPAVAGLVGADADLFVITWSERGHINARVFRKEDGTPFSDEQTIVAAEDYNTQVYAPSIVAIPNGGFYLVYMSGVVVKGAYEYRIKAVRFFLSEF